jgi:ubiquinone/menaquinone biosynthesis C-methylase UbiE
MNEGPTEPVFNTVADTYDNIKILQGTAEKLVEYAKLSSGQRVLDVACATGFSTMPAARIVGNTGKVIGIDIADKLLEVARAKADSAGLSNIEYRVGNAEVLEFEDASFDAVICASSIFLFRDIPKALREWHRVLKAGGTIAFSSFEKDHLQPVSGLLDKHLARYEGRALIGQQPEGKTDTPGKCRELLKDAGIEKIKIIAEQLGSYLQGAMTCWNEVSYTIVRLRRTRFSPDTLEKFKAEYFAEVDTYRTERGIWINVPALFSIAKKPSA